MYNNLVSLNSWKASYNNASFKRLASNNEIYRFIREHIPRPNTKFRTVLEVGSYPGTYLSEFGEMGFELYGVDVEPKNSIELPEQFRRFNYKIGKFYCQEFESLSIDKKYDVVCSFGFIEHYKNFEEILISHAELVNHKGYLLITAPNFRGGVQNILHRYFAPLDYRNHYIPSMNPSKWAEILSKEGFAIVFSGYFGGFRFWVHPEKKGLFKTFLYKITIKLLNIIGKFIKGNALFYSKYCGIVAIKK